MLATLAVAVAVQATPIGAPLPDHAFVLTGAGRFAVLADMASIVREDADRVTLRALQVGETSFSVGGVSYWGGWSRWRFDCAGLTADRLDFASVREGGAEGPITPEPAPAYPAAPGGDAAELLAVACSTETRAPDVTTLEDAVILGRAALAGDPAPTR